jgi:class 3 adenylate cyclase
VLPSVQSPALVLHRTGDVISEIGHGRFLAAHLPDARLVELTGDDGLLFAGDTEAVIAEIQSFLTGANVQIDPDRILASLLFTDVVESTRHLQQVGDGEGSRLLEELAHRTELEVDRHRGRVVRHMGDGCFAVFDGPAAAIRAAQAVQLAAAELGLMIRSGVHTGEVERRSDDLLGIAVHIAARVSALAEPGEVWVSRTVTDLVAGSGLSFDARGAHELKGVPGRWELSAVQAGRA